MNCQAACKKDKCCVLLLEKNQFVLLLQLDFRFRLSRCVFGSVSATAKLKVTQWYCIFLIYAFVGIFWIPLKVYLTCSRESNRNVYTLLTCYRFVWFIFISIFRDVEIEPKHIKIKNKLTFMNTWSKRCCISKV